MNNKWKVAFTPLEIYQKMYKNMDFPMVFTCMGNF